VIDKVSWTKGDLERTKKALEAGYAVADNSNLNMDQDTVAVSEEFMKTFGLTKFEKEVRKLNGEANPS